jgi:hypothetical protein
VTPLTNGVANIFAGLKHGRPQPSLQHVRGGSKTDRAGADNRNRLCLIHVVLLSN